MLQEESDAILVTRALADNKQAFTLLIERYQEMALLLALRYCEDREIARELAQEALLQSYLSLHHLREPAHFKSWFYGIVLNLCRNWLRERTREPAMQDLSQVHAELLGADPQELFEERELRQALYEAVDVLSANNRSVAQLFYYEDCSIQSIASLLHLSPTAVRNRLFKGREQLRAHLKRVYPDLAVMTPRHYRRTTMLPMTLARVHYQERRRRTITILIDKSQRQALLLWFMKEHDFSSQLRMYTSTQQKDASVEPLTTNFILNILQVLHGTLERIEIDTLQSEILYARVLLRGPDDVQHSIKARIEDALPLAVESHCPIEVAEEVLEQQGLQLASFGETFEAQLDKVVRQAEQASGLGSSSGLTISTVPSRLDFTNGFRGWSFMGYPEKPKRYDYQLDTSTIHKNKTSLAITLSEQEQVTEDTHSMNFVYLMHEGFLADDYHGKRLRMSAYARAEQVKQGIFNLHIHGSTNDKEGEERISMAITSNQHEPIEGTSDWRRYELVIDVPKDAKSISCSFHLTGAGKIWLDGFQFEAVDSSVPLTGSRIMPPPRKPTNLSFEHNFDGWLIAGGSPQDYTRSIESTEQGHSIVLLKNAVEQPRGSIILQQIVNIYEYRGQTIHLSAEIRTQDITQQASFYLLYNPKGDTRIERTIQGTTDWQTYDILFSIPDEPGQIEFGLLLFGSGQIWFRNPQLLTQQKNTL